MTILELQRALAAHPKWIWLPGMHAIDPADPVFSGRVLLVSPVGTILLSVGWVGRTLLPDLSDFCTLGGLLLRMGGRLMRGDDCCEGGVPWLVMWEHPTRGTVYDEGDTAAEAIGRAMLAWMGAA